MIREADDCPAWADMEYEVFRGDRLLLRFGVRVMSLIRREAYVYVRGLSDLNVADLLYLRKQKLELLDNMRLQAYVEKNDTCAARFAEFFGFSLRGEVEEYDIYRRGE